MFRLTHILSFSLIFGMLMLTACGDKGGNGSSGNSTDSTRNSPGEKENGTRGEIWISVDETFEPLVEQFLQIWRSDYPEGIIHADYKPGEAAMKDLMLDSVRLVITGREFLDNEAARLRSQQIIPKTTRIGKGAVTLLVNESLPVDSLDASQVKQILMGEKTLWSELIEGAPDQPITVLFDHPQTSLLRHMAEFCGVDSAFGGQVYSANGIDSLFTMLKARKYALGFVGESYVIDKRDPAVKARLKGLRMVRLDAPETSDLPGRHVRPYATEIALGRYPLLRPVMVLSREHFMGLGTGFVTFLTGEKGQRIMLKAGLLPEEIPPREIGFTE